MRSSRGPTRRTERPGHPPDAPTSIPSCWSITAFPASVILPQMNRQPMCIWVVKPPFTQYISRDVLWNAPYPVNAQGENDGALVIPGNSHLDLILARGIDGTSGFVRAEELELNSWGETSKDTALFMKRYEGVQLIPLYDLNGRLLARI